MNQRKMDEVKRRWSSWREDDRDEEKSEEERRREKKIDELR